jgi:hypothetical protein
MEARLNSIIKEQASQVRPYKLRGKAGEVMAYSGKVLPHYVRSLSEKQYQRLVNRKPVRIVVGGIVLTLQSGNVTIYRQIAQKQAEIKQLKKKLQ